MRPEDGEALGSGSAGAVFALPSDEGDVAVKVFPGRLYERTRLRLEHELERLSALDGQILVPGAIEELPDGRCALRSELCTRSLLDLVESTGPLSVSDTLVLGSAIASTLARAHEAGIVHGRLTPANVLFRASGEPVINDFERTLRPVFVRDPDHGSDFLAPEGPHGEGADLYGLGAVLHFALTGLPPGPDRPELHRVDAPIDLLSLTENLLAEDPDSRPAGMAVVEEILIALTPEPSTVDEEAPVVVSRGIQGYPLLTIDRNRRRHPSPARGPPGRCSPSARPPCSRPRPGSSSPFAGTGASGSGTAQPGEDEHEPETRTAGGTGRTDRPRLDGRADLAGTGGVRLGRRRRGRHRRGQDHDRPPAADDEDPRRPWPEVLLPRPDHRRR